MLFRSWCDWEDPIERLKKYAACVSIPAWCDWEGGDFDFRKKRNVSFNSSLVRLGALPSRSAKLVIVCFNSSLVRLGGLLSSSFITALLFQFQLGAIGSFWL